MDVGNVLELNDKQRVDAINNFDFARDFDTRVNGSKFLTLQNRTLTDFTRCKTNRVLLHDDISDNFSSEGFESTSTLIEPLIEDFGNYLVQIVDPDTLDVQFTEIVALTTENDAFILEKNTDFTNVNLGDFSEDEFRDFIKPLELISFKPTLYVCNVGESEVVDGNDYVEMVKKEVHDKSSDVIIISAKIESEINELDSLDEKQMFLDDLGLEESGSNKLIRASYKLLNLHSYFTAGEKEVRGWTIKIGDSAYDAAGQIHTDFQKGFICAEVISYNDYIELGSELKVKEAGKMRLEGKEYIVSDGDIMHFRFNI